MLKRGINASTAVGSYDWNNNPVTPDQNRGFTLAACASRAGSGGPYFISAHQGGTANQLVNLNASYGGSAGVWQYNINVRAGGSETISSNGLTGTIPDSDIAYFGGVIHAADDTVTLFDSVNGSANSGATTLSNSPTGIDSVSALGSKPGETSFVGKFFYSAYWDAELTQPEYEALTSGVSPLRIRRDKLVHCFAWNGTKVVDLCHGDVLTAVGGGTYTAVSNPLPFRASRGGILVPFASSGGSTSQPVGQLTESETLFSAAPVADFTQSTGLVTEAETIFAVTAVTGQAISTGLITESESLFAASSIVDQLVSVGLITESESVFSVSSIVGSTQTVGQLTESETLFSPTVVSGQLVSVGQIDEQETLFTISAIVDYIATTGLITESEQLFAVSVQSGDVVSVNLIAESESIFSVSAIVDQLIATGLIEEAETLSSVVAVFDQSIAVGLITEAESLFAVTVSEGGSDTPHKTLTINGLQVELTVTALQPILTVQ